MTDDRSASSSNVTSNASVRLDETLRLDSDVIESQNIVLRAERLEGIKRRVQGRVASITRRAVTVRQTIEVDVLHEELVVDYLPGDGSMMAADNTAETIVVLLRAEDVEVVKRTRVVEEVRITTRSVEEQQRLTDTVRHETLEVVQSP